MSDESHFTDSVRENSYAHYNLYHCDTCDVNIPMNQLSEHVAKKHRGMRFDAYPSSDSDDDVSSMNNGIGRNRVSKKQLTKRTTNIGHDYVGKQHDAAAVAGIGAAPAPADTIATQTSGDETDYKPVDRSLSMKKGLFDDDDGGGTVTTSTPIGPAQNVRSTARLSVRNRMRSAMGQLNDGGGETDGQNRQRKIPTAHELFDYSHSQGEFRTSNLNGGGGGRSYDNGDDDGKLRRNGLAYRRRSAPVPREPPVIPENFKACKFCLNVMHQDYMRAHIERKHRQSLPVANEFSTSAEISGINFIAKTSDKVDDTGNGNGVADGGGIGGINDAIVVKMEKSEEPIFTRCKLCSAHMHIHYMPLHLVRKHRTEYDGSAGFSWTQCTDDQVNQLLNSGRVYVKNGAFYIGDLE